MCSIAILFDTSITKFDAKKTIFLHIMLRLCKLLGKIIFLRIKLSVLEVFIS